MRPLDNLRRGKNLKRSLIIAVVALALAAPASGAIGPLSDPHVTDPVITSASYNSSTWILTLTWTMGAATNGGRSSKLWARS